MAQNSYWKSYRRIQSNLREHISSIYLSDQLIPENSQYHDDSDTHIENQQFSNTTQMPESEFHSCVDMDQGGNVVEGPDLINDHAAVGDNEACDSFSNCSETFSTCSVSSTDSEFIDDD